MGVSDLLDEAATQIWENLKDDPDAYIELRPRLLKLLEEMAAISDVLRTAPGHTVPSRPEWLTAGDIVKEICEQGA